MIQCGRKLLIFFRALHFQKGRPNGILYLKKKMLKTVASNPSSIIIELIENKKSKQRFKKDIQLCSNTATLIILHKNL